MSTSLRENQLIIRACILYEALDKKPIQESYKNFCRKVGKDVMTFYEFDFWYWRFYHGNHDLHYDRSFDPAPSPMSDMPINVIQKIVGYVDSIDTLALMKVSRKFRKIAQKSDVRIEDLSVMYQEDEECCEVVSNWRHKITYARDSYSCRITYQNGEDERKEKFVGGENYVELCNNDLKLLMENRTVQLKTFSFTVFESEEEGNGFRENRIKDITKILNSTKSLMTKTIKSTNLSFPEFASLLSIFPAKNLQKIIFEAGFQPTHFGYKQLVRMNQWKMAKEFHGD